MQTDFNVKIQTEMFCLIIMNKSEWYIGPIVSLKLTVIIHFYNKRMETLKYLYYNFIYLLYIIVFI